MKLSGPISFLFVLLFCISAFSAKAQFETVYIGVNGLTCSQCTKTVEMSIRKLDFVEDVKMNLQHTEGKIVLKKDKKPDMDKIAQAVINAGFSVRFLDADLVVGSLVAASGSCFSYNGDAFVFSQAPENLLKGTVRLKFIGKKFLPKNELKKIPAVSDNKCSAASGKVYQVAL
jgi:copper chaperone CopZ